VPIADPERSFDATIRHLFRHIRDADALRRNPIVAPLFEEQRNKDADRVALALLRAQILALATACRQEDVRQRRVAQASRQYTIVENLCAGESPTITARKLNLSLRQYYRERRTICSRIGRRMMKGQVTAASTVDTDEQLELACRRARNLAEQGFTARAVQLLQQVVAEASSGSSKTVALLHLSRIFALHGDVTSATAAFDDADRLASDGSTRRSLTLDLIQALAAADRHYEVGDYARASTIIARLPKLAPSTVADMPIAAQEALIEGYIERIGYAHGLDDSRRLLDELQRMVQLVGRISPYLEVLVAFQEALHAEGDRDCPEHALLQHDRLLKLSEVTGSTRGIVGALSGLTRYHLRVGSEDEAYRCFKRAYAIAHVVEGSRLKLQVAAQAPHFMPTRFSQAVASVIDEGIALARPGTAYAARLKAASGQYLARKGRVNEALAVLDQALTAAKAFGSSFPQPTIVRDYAVALYRAGHRDKARELIQEAVLMAEQSLNGLVLSETYRVATHILMNREL
jgi:tetratricopeptide (TPR) repeat protein